MPWGVQEIQLILESSLLGGGGGGGGARLQKEGRKEGTRPGQSQLAKQCRNMDISMYIWITAKSACFCLLYSNESTVEVTEIPLKNVLEKY